MSNNPEFLYLVNQTLNLFPPSIRSDMLSRDIILKKFGAPAKIVVSLSQPDLEFDRSSLFEAIRKTVNYSESVTIENIKNETWTVQKETINGHSVILLVGKNRNIQISDIYWCFHLDADYRIKRLSTEGSVHNLPTSVYQKWYEILKVRVLTDDEWESLREDFNLCATAQFHQLLESRGSSSNTIESFVPRTLAYYERLVGKWNTEESVIEYSEQVLKCHIQRLLEWDQIEGLKLALLLCSHSSISEVIDLSTLSSESIKSVFDWVVDQGDLTSMIAAAELGLKWVENFPIITSPVEKIFENIRDIIVQDVNAQSATGRIALHSALVILVFGENTRTACLEERPAYWRRLASMTHASLIERAMNGALEVTSFSAFVYEVVGVIFFYKTLADLRSEPRWLPEYIDPIQVRLDIVGRLVNVVHRYSTKINSEKLVEIVDGPKGIKSFFKFPNSIYAGPLEGNIPSATELPTEFITEIENATLSEKIEVNSFARLVNASRLCRVTEQHALIAADALKRTQYYVNNPGDSRQQIALIGGLAEVAANSRSVELAEAVRTLARMLRRRNATELGALDELRFLLIAAAAHEDDGKWIKLIGEWITEIAREVPLGETAKVFLSHLRVLIRVEPRLAKSCCKADAILSLAAESA